MAVAGLRVNQDLGQHLIVLHNSKSTKQNKIIQKIFSLKTNTLYFYMCVHMSTHEHSQYCIKSVTCITKFTVTFSKGPKQPRFLKNLSLQRADRQIYKKKPLVTNACHFTFFCPQFTWKPSQPRKTLVSQLRVGGWRVLKSAEEGCDF